MRESARLLVPSGMSAVRAMIGLDTSGRPHAAQFNVDREDMAAFEAAAAASGYHAVAPTDALVEVVYGLPMGVLFPSGKAFVPFVKRPIFDQLATLVDGKIQRAPRSRAATRRKKWQAYVDDSHLNAVIPGTVMLARYGGDGIWREAVVRSIVPEGMELSWRGLPDETPFTAPYAHVVPAPRFG